jgi:hypothetical protein
MGGEDVVEEVKGVEEVGVGFACRGRGVEGIEGAFCINSTLFFLIVGGLYSVTALRKNKKEGDSVCYFIFFDGAVIY